SAPAPVDPESVPRPGEPVATPQVVPTTPFCPKAGVGLVSAVILPSELSVSADNDSCSSAALELCTTTLYLMVAQPSVIRTIPLVVVAVLGASSDKTVTLLELVGPKVPLDAP